jgi:bacillolysin
MSRIRSSVVVCSLLTAALLATPPLAAQVGPSPEVRAALQLMELSAEGPVSTTLSPDTGLVTFLTTEGQRPLPVTGVGTGAGPEEVALAFLRSYGNAFGFRDTAQVEPEGPADRDELGLDHVRFRQVVQGVPVTAGELTVHLQGSGVVSVNAETLPDLEGFDARPTFPVEAAVARTRDYLARRLDQRDAELSEPRLEILNRGLLEGGRQATRLAWFVEARGPALREYLWIDAKTGRFLLRFSQLTSALHRDVYNANSLSTLPGTLVRTEGGPATGDADADAAYQFSGDTYDYYLSRHGRDSFDAAGGALISTAHYCPSAGSCPYQNAFWNGSQMVYGNGFSAADDVDAHELTHAVTERTANLFYYMQSGALNESFSDMFGETVDLTNSGGTDTPAVRWKMGEDVPGFGAIRDMMNPGAFFDPAKVNDVNYFCSYFDGGGVHTNSGVPNHFYALLADGGTFNSVNVTGVGLTKAGKIAYRALTKYLLSGSGFADAANAFRQSCADLVGTVGITTGDCQQVANALAAVEMTAVPPCTLASAGQIPAFCPAGQHPVNLFFDDFETGGSNTSWFASATDLNMWFFDPSGYTTSGTWHMVGYDDEVINDARAFMSNSVTLPAGARMQFNHSWDFDPPTYDGGVVEYSLNGGTTWNDAVVGLFSAGSPYSGIVTSGYGNPLGGRSGFVGASRGYTGTQLNLASLAGQNVKFRFRMGSDDAFYWWGWDVDDVRIYTCAACSYSLGANAGFVGAAGGSGTVAVSTSDGCAWSVSSGAAWVTATNGDGSGGGSAGFTAEPNLGSSPRSAALTIAGQTFTVYEGAATDFYTLTPCRVFDTRTSTPLASGVPRSFAVAGTCGIPASAKAVSVNVTVVNATSQGNVTLFPGGVGKPGTSSVNFAGGTTRANNAILVLAPDGTGSLQGSAFVLGSGTVDVLLDVNGYFE